MEATFILSVMSYEFLHQSQNPVLEKRRGDTRNFIIDK
jgi:hypothetical protein